MKDFSQLRSLLNERGPHAAGLPYHVIAIFYAEIGKEDEMEGVLRELIEPTRREAGCIRYDLLRSLKGESYVEFVFVEEWASEEELDAHGESEHLEQLRGPAQGLDGLAAARDPLPPGGMNTGRPWPGDLTLGPSPKRGRAQHGPHRLVPLLL